MIVVAIFIRYDCVCGVDQRTENHLQSPVWGEMFGLFQVHRSAHGATIALLFHLAEVQRMIRNIRSPADWNKLKDPRIVTAFVFSRGRARER